MSELKVPLTYQEQIKRLVQNHNLRVDNTKEALKILESVNYYRLSGYGIGLKKPDDVEKYNDGVSIEQLYRIYEFDEQLRNHILLPLEKVEIRLRTQIANYFSLQYGALAYLNSENFESVFSRNGKSIHQVIIEKFKSECARQSAVPFVRHHNEKYNGEFPLWVAVELFTFGNLSSFFSIMKKKDKKALANLYNTTPPYLGSWILTLVEIRNICAHYGRLYNMPLKQRPRLYSEDRKHCQSTQSKLFPALLCLKRILQKDSTWGNLGKRLCELIRTYSDEVNLAFMGFPADWEKVLQL